MCILGPVQLLALNPGLDLHFALHAERCPMSISLLSVLNDCVIVFQVDILYFISYPDLSWETDALCPKPDFFAAPPEVLETVGSSQQAQACPSGSLFLSRDLPGQKVGCAFRAGGAALPPPPCSRVYVEYFLPEPLSLEQPETENSAIGFLKDIPSPSLDPGWAVTLG